MSHIPSSAVPHAKPHEHHDDAPAKPEASKTASAPDAREQASAYADKAVEAVKANPKTAIAIGAALIAGIAAAVAAPAVLAKANAKPAARRKAPAKKAPVKKAAKA